MKLYYSNVSKNILSIKIDKRKECFNFGDDNAYPSLVETLYTMSVTAKNCAEKKAKSIYGKAFGDIGKMKVNPKGQTLNEILRIASIQYAKFNNCYFHIRYNANLNISAISVIPVTHVRLGKADDKGYSGKYIVYDNWDKSRIRKIEPSKFQVINRFNNSKVVIEKQIRNDAKDNTSAIVDIIQEYEGQILHIQKDFEYKYSLSDLHSVMNDAITEYNSQLFRSSGAKKGFLNTKLLVTQPFANDDERKDFKKEINGLRGAENSSDVIVLEMSQQSDEMDKQIKLDDLSGRYNDRLFEYSDKQAERNICKAFNVPVILIAQNDGSMFSSSGEVLKEAKVQMWENNENVRIQLEENISLVMSGFETPITEPLTIINPYNETQL